MGKHSYRIYKIPNTIMKVSLVIIVLFIGLNFTKNSFNGLFYSNNKKISEIINELPKKYQSYIDISSNNGIIKGNMIRNNSNVVIDIKEPMVLLGTQISYDGDNVTIKFKDIESRFNKNSVIDRFPISVVIEIENMILNGQYTKWNIKDEILIVEGKYKNQSFTGKIDLRKNKIISICLEDENIFAYYQN